MRLMLRRFLAPCLAALALVAVSHAEGLSVEARAKVFDKIVSILKTTAYLPEVTNEQLDKAVADNRDKIINEETDARFGASIDRFLDQWHFSHINLLTPTEAKRRSTQKMVGLGVEMNTSGGSVEVVYVYPGSGADDIGLRPGDRILEIDGEPYSRLKGASGEPGATFSLTYATPDGAKHTRRVVRKNFNLQKTVVAKMLDNSTGYIRLWSFTPYSYKEVREAFEKLGNAPNLVVDLRLNSGGSVMNMIDFLSYFLPAKTRIGAFYSKREDGTVSEQPSVIGTARKMKYRGHVALLIDEGSASASEITAAALQESHRAVVVGHRSARAVLSSTFVSIGEGYQLQIPIADYKTVAGVRLEGNGVTPDLVMERMPRVLPNEPDEVVDTARRVLLGEVKVPPKSDAQTLHTQRVSRPRRG